MSGIVGLFRPDGTAVDVALARALTRFLAFRGPDGRETWCGGPVALGHAMLRTTEESALERQPATLDGRLWITADVRLDARDELRGALQQAGREAARNAPDSELILHAYAAWGEECLERLRGDFAFGIWDARRRTLFCARDHFGIKPFYFAEHRDFFLFSNTLNCVRMHPDVSDELNEAAIADFLLFGLNCDPETTTFRAIRRLPPAHFLRVSADGLRTGRYWTLPIDGRIRYARAEEYVEHFRLLLREAVSDRLRGERVGIFLSGGLDSSSVAAMARELSPERGGAGKLRAYTVTMAPLIADSDGPYARQVAEFLGIPLRTIDLHDARPYQDWDQPQFQMPEPTDNPLFAAFIRQFEMTAADCRVVLDGEGSDDLMIFRMWPHVRDLLKHGEWAQLSADLRLYVQFRRPLWRSALRVLRRKLRPAGTPPIFPRWLNPEFARRVDATGRWRESDVADTGTVHSIAPRAYASLLMPQWTRLFESQDPGVSKHLVEVRYPFLDLRIVSFVLAIPPFPWYFHKRLLREAMAARLPEAVRVRPKTVPEADSLAGMVRAQERMPETGNRWEAESARFIDASSFQFVANEKNRWRIDAEMRPLSLNYWLQHSRPVQYKLTAEVRNG